jgi:hypothetical protein
MSKKAMAKIVEINKQELSSERVELGILDDISSDVRANGSGTSKARILLRDAYGNLGKAFGLYEDAIKRNNSIEKNSTKFKQEVDNLGISSKNLDQIGKFAYEGLYVSKVLETDLKAVQKAVQALKQSSEI